MIFHQQDPVLPPRGFGPVRGAGEAAVRRRRGALLERGGGERRRPHQVLRGRPQEGTGRARGEVLREGDAVRVVCCASSSMLSLFSVDSCFAEAI